MAPWWLLRGTALLLLVLLFVNQVWTQSTCDGGAPGIPGIPGTHGINGRDGSRGEKGEPGEVAIPVRGQKGDMGLRGAPGRPGLKGDVGLTGPPGYPGQPGEKGRPFSPTIDREMFSRKREIPHVPVMDFPMDFNRPFLPDLDSQFQGATLTDATFVCKTKGVYFFSFHVSAKTRVCLKLMKGIDVLQTLCDNWDGFLVTSSSAVVALEVGDVVSLQTTRYNNIVTGFASSHTFTGFLIFRT